MKWQCLKFPDHYSVYSGPMNEMLVLPKLLFLKGISKYICDLALYIFLEGTDSSIVKFPF